MATLDITTKEQMLGLIDAIRAEHHACTGRALAARIGWPQTSVFRLLDGLKEEGLVAWTIMPGSLRTIRVGNGDLPAPPPGVVPLSTPLPPPPPPPAPVKRAAKKTAKRKRPSRAEERERRAAREAASHGA